MATSTTAALRRPWGSPLARRALVLSGLAAGVWLAGSATSSAAAAEPVPAQPTASVQGLADLAGALLTPVPTAVAPVVAPVVETTVTPIAQTLAPVGERLVAPVLRAVEPVTAPVVTALSPVLSPVLDPVVASVAPVLQPVAAALAPVLEPVRPVLGVGVEPVRVPAAQAVVMVSGSLLDAPELVPTTAEITGPAASVLATATAGSDTRPGVVEQLTGAAFDAPAPVPGGRNVPVPGPALPSGAPAPAVASGPSSSDQHAADLPPAADAVDLVALGAAADGARDAAADRALDPSFAPD